MGIGQDRLRRAATPQVEVVPCPVPDHESGVRRLLSWIDTGRSCAVMTPTHCAAAPGGRRPWRGRELSAGPGVRASLHLPSLTPRATRQRLCYPTRRTLGRVLSDSRPVCAEPGSDEAPVGIPDTRTRRGLSTGPPSWPQLSSDQGIRARKGGWQPPCRRDGWR